MHKYLKAIGFSNYTKHKEIQQLLNLVYENPDAIDSVNTDPFNRDHDVLVSISKNFGEGFGIQIFGEYDGNGHFHMDYYFPYVTSNFAPRDLTISIRRHSDKSAYSAMCEEYNLGISLIYYIQNPINYLRFKLYYIKPDGVFPVRLCALSTNGKILFPVLKNKKEQEKLKVLSKQRAKLMDDAKNGDEDAIEDLTMEDMNLFNTAIRRIQNEDLYSIVNTSFIPNGVECDHYSVVGEIIDCKEVENTITNEKLYSLHVESNDIDFQVLINQADLLGVPDIGRRFKGDIWLQGQVLFRE